MNSVIAGYIDERIKSGAIFGRPSWLELFVRRNGTDFAGVEAYEDMGEPKMCYQNATLLACLERADATYVEGFVVNPEIPMLIHHAWVEIDGQGFDPTIPDARNRLYYGVRFTTKTVRAQVKKNGVYGLLDTGWGLNMDLMESMDPGLREAGEQVDDEILKVRQAFMQLQAQHANGPDLSAL